MYGSSQPPLQTDFNFSFSAIQKWLTAKNKKRTKLLPACNASNRLIPIYCLDGITSSSFLSVISNTLIDALLFAF
jgi:hypothetical protein